MITGVYLIAPPASHLEGGSLPGILREMDLAAAVGLMAPRPVGIVGTNRLSDWYALRWGHRVYHRLGIPERHALGRIVGEVREVVLTVANRRQPIAAFPNKGVEPFAASKHNTRLACRVPTSTVLKVFHVTNPCRAMRRSLAGLDSQACR